MAFFTTFPPVTISASNEIIIEPGGSIGNGITLEINPDPSIPCSSSIPPYPYVNDFCTVGNYQANQAMSKTNYVDTSKNIIATQNNFNINLYPNPANSECTVRFTESAGTDVTITLIDIMGRDVAVLDHSWHSQGTSFVPFSTESYAPGVYSVRFSDGTNTSTQRVTISGR